MAWQEAKAKGNDAYKAGDTKGAIAHYSAALQADDCPAADRALILCNRAQCFLKTGDNQSAIEDCTACLTHSPDNVKAIFRRASAYEASGEVKDALVDYKRAVELAPGLPEAVAGINRCEVALGIKPAPTAKKTTTVAAPGGGASAGRPAGSAAPGASGMSPEDQKAFEELQARVRDVAMSKMRAQEQMRNATSEKRKADLTISQVTPLPEDRPVYTSLGRMFVRSPKAEVLANVQAAAAKSDTRAAVCAKTLAHLEGQEREADAAFMEFVSGLQRRTGGQVRMTAA